MWFVFLFLSSFLCVLNYPVIAAEFFTEAKSAVAIDAVTGEVLFEHNAYEPLPPSSMSKLMTLYILFGYLADGSIKVDDLVTVSKQAWLRGGSSMFLKERQKVSVRDLISGIAVVSGNDASIVIAETLKGTQEDFAMEMNRYGKMLGLQNSHFVNSTGWPEEGHYMSVYDIAILGRRLFYDFNQYYYVFSLAELEYNGVKQVNTNSLLFKNTPHLKFDGVKTGFSNSAGYGVIISALNDEGNRIFVVVNGLDSPSKRFSEAYKVVNYIFDSFSFKQLYKKNVALDKVSVIYGKEKKVGVYAKEDVNLVYQNTAKAADIKTVFSYKNDIKAPLHKGDELGELTVVVNDGQPKTFPLYAINDVKEISAVKKVFYKIFAIYNTKK